MGGSPYLGKLTSDDKKFFSDRKGGSTLHKSDRVKKEEKKDQDPLYLRGQKDRG